MNVKLKRVNEQPEDSDGCRILVDRLWPRGLSKEKAHIDLWLKEIAPSTPLRRWYDHDPARWPEFKRRYVVKLEANRRNVRELLRLVKKGPVTLVFGSRERSLNNAAVLKLFLEELG